ncbi:MAG TPA: helix-turn-helix domain-containing protein [Terriglobia bacterium]
MPRRLPVPEGLAEKVKLTVRKARGAGELREALCVWLRLGLGLSAAQIATALVCTRANVRRVHSYYLRDRKAEPKRRPWAESSVERLRAALKKARSADELREVLCVWLRVALGLSVSQIATALGWTRSYVHRLQGRFLREGEAVLTRPGSGGRRHSILSQEQEYALLRRLRLEAFPGGVLEYRAIHRAVEQEAGRKVAPSTVTRMLTRHGWVRQALVASIGHSPALNPAREGLRKSGAWEPLQPEAGERGSTPGSARSDFGPAASKLQPEAGGQGPPTAGEPARSGD